MSTELFGDKVGRGGLVKRNVRNIFNLGWREKACSGRFKRTGREGNSGHAGTEVETLLGEGEDGDEDMGKTLVKGFCCPVPDERTRVAPGLQPPNVVSGAVHVIES